MKFYEVQQQLNNLHWINLAYFRKEEDALEYIQFYNTKVVVYPVRIQERNFSKLSDFKED